MEKETKDTKQKSHDAKVNSSKGHILYTSLLILLGVFLVLTVVNAFVIAGISATLKSKESAIKEQNRAAFLQITEITTDCTDCYDISSVESSIYGKNVNVTSSKKLSRTSAEAQELIQKYHIDKLPSLIVTGEINRTKLNGFTETDNALVFTDVKLPYVLASTGATVGRVEVIKLIDSSCKECSDIESVVAVFKQLGVKIVNEKSVEYSSAEGKNMAKDYNVQKLPAIILSEDIALYDSLKEVWSQLNTTKKEGYYALHTVQAPYREVGTGLITGLIDLTMIVDKSCSGCYNVSAHEPILDRLGVYVKNKKILDISSTEAKTLISKYNITLVPTIVLSENAKEYPNFVDAWTQVGTTETDGKYIFRAVELMGTYKDVTTNKVVSQ